MSLTTALIVSDFTQAWFGGILGTGDTVHVEHAFDLTHCGKQSVQMLRISHFKAELAGGHTIRYPWKWSRK